MRSIVTSLLLLACASSFAIAHPAAAPASAANLVRLHPGPWQPPAAVRAGLRFEPEGGEAVTAGDATRAADDAVMRAPSQAAARALAAASVTLRADGSRHAVVGSAFRQWTVATIDDNGRLTQDCVQSEAEAKARVEAAGRKQVRK